MARDKAPPYIPLYHEAFLADENVQDMDTTEIGAFFLLLLKAWHPERRGTLPDDDDRLARWAKVTPADWAIAKPRVMAAWKLKDGKWHQKRLKREWANATQKMDERSESARIAARAKWAKHKHPKGSAEGNAASMRDASATDAAAMREPAIKGNVIERKGEEVNTSPPPAPPAASVGGGRGGGRKSGGIDALREKALNVAKEALANA